jgi:hypothetical protein
VKRIVDDFGGLRPVDVKCEARDESEEREGAETGIDRVRWSELVKSAKILDRSLME